MLWAKAKKHSRTARVPRPKERTGQESRSGSPASCCARQPVMAREQKLVGREEINRRSRTVRPLRHHAFPTTASARTNPLTGRNSRRTLKKENEEAADRRHRYGAVRFPQPVHALRRSGA